MYSFDRNGRVKLSLKFCLTFSHSSFLVIPVVFLFRLKMTIDIIVEISHVYLRVLIPLYQKNLD
jgi:hypothetical protein